MASIVKTIFVGNQRMAIYSAQPEGAGPFPGLVVIQHAPGVDTFMQAMVDRLAEAGYAAVAPDLYHRQPVHGLGGLQRMALLRDAEVEADVNATVEYLRTDPTVAHERLGIIGFCMGGRVAYLMAAAHPRFQACVVYYGGNIMVPWGEGVASPFARTGEISAPILFHFGEEDTNPSPDDRRKLDAELTRHGKAHEFHAYPGAAHAFMNFTNLERYREAASTASWPRTLDFLARHLRRG
jgi:carboxymethylenebutenolidase